MSELILNCDGKVAFAENAAIASWFVIQSAHWKHGAATLIMFGCQIASMRV